MIARFLRGECTNKVVIPCSVIRLQPEMSSRLIVLVLNARRSVSVRSVSVSRKRTAVAISPTPQSRMIEINRMMYTASAWRIAPPAIICRQRGIQPITRNAPNMKYRTRRPNGSKYSAEGCIFTGGPGSIKLMSEYRSRDQKAKVPAMALKSQSLRRRVLHGR